MQCASRLFLVVAVLLGIAFPLHGSDGEAEVDPARLAEINAIGKKDDEASRESLMKLIQDTKAAAAEREAAIKSLAQTRSGGLALIAMAKEEKISDEFKATASFACANSADAEVRAQGDKELPLPRTKDGQVLPPIPKMAEMKGDAKAGAEVFKNVKGANCIGCHQIGDDGKMVGPPLSSIGEKLGKEQIYEAILTPSASILMGYENWIVKTKDGKIQSGIKAEDTDDHVTLKDTQAEFHDIPTDQIVKKVKLAVSLMPEGLTKTMTLQDLVNLVEFLSQQKYK